MEKMIRRGGGYTYVFETEIDAGETVIVDIPDASADKRGITEIAWQSDSDDVKLYGTLSSDPENTELWDEITAGDDINKAVTALKFTATENADVILRVVME